MELYGVQHGHWLEFGGIKIGESLGLPSEEMLESIRSLPKGTVVGVEATPEYFTGEEFAEGVFFPTDQASYWQAIIDVCHERDHEVVYLDDIELYKEVAKAHIAAKKLAKGLENEREKLSPEAIEEAQKLIFALIMRAEYIYTIERERSIYEKMVISDPDIAVIGIAHGDYLYSNSTKIGVEIEAYWQGVFDEIDTTLSTWERTDILLGDYLPEVSEQYIRPPQLNGSGLKQKEAVIRGYNAVTKGRILPEREEEPGWIGTWRLEQQAEGLFEVYIEQDEDDNGITKGIIEDNLGTATFEGVFNDREVNFIKTYLPDQVFNDAAAEIPLHYYAKRVSDDEYNGQYGYINGLVSFRWRESLS